MSVLQRKSHSHLHFLWDLEELTADTDLLKKVPFEILLNFGNYFCT